MSASSQCPHLEFDAKVTVARLEDSTLKYAEVTIVCLNCGKPAVFRGQIGVQPDRATRSADGQEARLPFVIDTDSEPTGNIGFTINIGEPHP